MEQRKWKNKIKKACRDAGTYKPYFDNVIDTLASILEKRDEAEAQENFLKNEGTGAEHPLIPPNF